MGENEIDATNAKSVETKAVYMPIGTYLVASIGTVVTNKDGNKKIYGFRQTVTDNIYGISQTVVETVDKFF